MVRPFLASICMAAARSGESSEAPDAEAGVVEEGEPLAGGRAASRLVIRRDAARDHCPQTENDRYLMRPHFDYLSLSRRLVRAPVGTDPPACAFCPVTFGTHAARKRGRSRDAGDTPLASQWPGGARPFSARRNRGVRPVLPAVQRSVRGARICAPSLTFHVDVAGSRRRSCTSAPGADACSRGKSPCLNDAASPCKPVAFALSSDALHFVGDGPSRFPRSRRLRAMHGVQTSRIS